jgi:hypothetical protein
MRPSPPLAPTPDNVHFRRRRAGRAADWGPLRTGRRSDR